MAPCDQLGSIDAPEVFSPPGGASTRTGDPAVTILQLESGRKLL